VCPDHDAWQQPRRRTGGASNRTWTARAYGRIRSRVRRHSREGSDAGFTLIELVIVTTILPLVVGGISVALLSVLSNEKTVSSRTSNSADTSVLSANFVKDVQSAQEVTTAPAVASPSPCVSTTGILSLQWQASGQTAVVTYAVVPHGKSSQLVRYYCQGLSAPSTTVVAGNVQSTLTASLTGSNCTQYQCTPLDVSTKWGSAIGVSAVQLAVQAPEVARTSTTKDNYTLTAVPRVSNNVSRGGPPPGHAPFLLLGSGTPAVSCTGQDSISVTGTAAINSTGTAVHTNGTASFSASSTYVGNSNGSNAFSGPNISPSTPTQAGVTVTDPYQGLPTPVTEPIPGGVTAGSTYNGLRVFADSNLALDGPGIYLNTVSINSATVIASGTYVFQNGLKVSGNGGLTGVLGNSVAVLFYIYRGGVTLNGGGSVSLAVLSSTLAGQAGITIWMDQGDSSSLNLGGNGAAAVISGTVYAPSAVASVGGNGLLDLGSLVTSSVSCNGGGNAGAIRINYGGS
jgi:prepilin-type N-terminal cleavage/methylation domain-containing protein